jgi:hypothetical protein
MSNYSPFDDDLLLQGTLVFRAMGRQDRKPQRGKRVPLKACGYF